MRRIKISTSLGNTIGSRDYWNFYFFPTFEIVKMDGYYEGNTEYPISIDFEWLCFYFSIKFGRTEE